MKRGQVLLGFAILLVAFLTILYNPGDKSATSMLLALAVILLGLLPLFLWLGNRHRDAIPIMHLHAVFYAVSFGVAGLREIEQSPNLGWLDEKAEQAALLMAALGLLSLYAGYFLIGPALYGKKANWRWPFQIRPATYSYLVIAVYPSVALLNKVVDTMQISTLGQTVGAVYTYILFIAMYVFFSGDLKGMTRQLFLFLAIPYQIFLASGLANGQIAGIVSMVTCMGITYCVTQNRVPYLFIVLAAGAFLLLQPIKGEFRQIIWAEQANLSAMEKVQTFLDMGYSYYFKADNQRYQLETGAKTTYSRINHLMVTAAVIADTPDRQPYLNGETYLPIFTKWIPRFIWADKPKEDLGNRWARDYGYLGADDFSTAFNLPWLPEMYMNFGASGVIGVSLCIGFFFHILAVNFWADPQTPSAFAFGMMIGTPLIFVESNLSMMLGGLVIGVVSLAAISLVMAKVFPKFITLVK